MRIMLVITLLLQTMFHPDIYMVFCSCVTFRLVSQSVCPTVAIHSKQTRVSTLPYNVKNVMCAVIFWFEGSPDVALKLKLDKA